VTPPALRLHAGDSIPWFQTLRYEARDSAGVPVSGFVPLLRAAPSNVVRLRGLYIVAIAPGRGTLLVQAVRHNASQTPPSDRPLTRVVVDVDAP
jgi:hypothetical protein